MLKKAMRQAENVLKAKYPDVADSIYKFVYIDEIKGVRVCENGTFKLFIWMPIKGSPEYSRRSALVEGGAPATGAEAFGPTDNIEYKNLADWEKERLRIMFKLDVSQEEDLDKICSWYAEEYKGKGRSLAEVKRIMFEDVSAAEKALSEVSIKQNLKPYADLLTAKEAELVEIEKKAAADFEGKEAFESLQAYMRRSMGYKVRLAILGDSEARRYFIGIDAAKYDPEQNKDWLKALIDDYKEKCKQFATDYAAGNAKIS